MELFYKLSHYLARSFAVFVLTIVAWRFSAGTTASNNVSRLYSAFFALLAVALYDRVLYHIFLSPLRGLPEVHLRDIRYLLPVTDVPRGDIALQWAKQYPKSDAVRVNLGLQTAMSPLSPEALRDVLSTHQADFVKPQAGRNFLSRMLGYGLILSEGLTHARQRKALTSSFRIQNIRALHDLMLSKTKIMISRMEEQSSREGYCEINSWASKVTLDIIGHSLMSQDFDSLRVERQPINEAFAELLAVSSGQAIHFILGMLLPKKVVCALPTATNRMIDRNTKIIHEACETSLRARKKSSKEVNPSSEILTSILKDPQISEQETIDQMRTFLGAGHETTATSVAWATHLLTLPQNRDYQEALRREISSHPECITSPTALEKLPWLNAVCEETLRLYPPVTTTARVAIRDTTVADTKVPKGTQLILFPWAINRHPTYWGGLQSEEFIPERWLDQGEDKVFRLNKHGGARSNYCELTFLHGNRACIGKDFSKAELRCILANLFGQFKVSRLDGDDLIAEPAGAITIKPKGGLFVRLQRVNEF